MSNHTDDLRIQDFLDRHDPDLLLTAFRDTHGGPTHMKRLGAMARALLRSGTRARRILDLASGPGDLGRTLALLEPDTRVDFVDRDPFVLALCDRINQRRRVSGRTFERDLWSLDWSDGLADEYDVITSAHGLRFLDAERITELFEEMSFMLRDGGQLMLCEPIPQMPPSDAHAAPATSHAGEWHGLFRRLDRHLGYPLRRGLIAAAPPGRHPIDDRGLPVREYLRLLSRAGFSRAEVIDRSHRDVTILASQQAVGKRAA